MMEIRFDNELAFAIAGLTGHKMLCAESQSINKSRFTLHLIDIESGLHNRLPQQISWPPLVGQPSAFLEPWLFLEKLDPLTISEGNGQQIQVYDVFKGKVILEEHNANLIQEEEKGVYLQAEGQSKLFKEGNKIIEARTIPTPSTKRPDQDIVKYWIHQDSPDYALTKINLEQMLDQEILASVFYHYERNFHTYLAQSVHNGAYLLCLKEENGEYKQFVKQQLAFHLQSIHQIEICLLPKFIVLMLNKINLLAYEIL